MNQEAWNKIYSVGQLDENGKTLTDYCADNLDKKIDQVGELIDAQKETIRNLVSIMKRTLDYGDDLLGKGALEGISYPLANWNGNAKRVREYLKSLEGV